MSTAGPRSLSTRARFQTPTTGDTGGVVQRASSWPSNEPGSSEAARPTTAALSSAGWRGDYDAWAASGCRGWSGEELRPLFARSIERLRVRHFSPDEIQPFQRGFLEAAVAAGIPQTDDLGDLDGKIGCGSEPMN